jgi:septum formation protein
VPFAVLTAEIDERPAANEPPVEVVHRLSRGKARAVAGLLGPGRIVLGADTVVALDGRVLGKPADAREAREMLRDLRGRTHHVFTGVSLIDTTRGEEVSSIAATLVRMRAYSDLEVRRYIMSGDPFDKAGGYAIQHDGFHPVQSISGCYANVMGLPLCHVIAGLQTLGQAVATDPSAVCCHLDERAPAVCPLSDPCPAGPEACLPAEERD